MVDIERVVSRRQQGEIEEIAWRARHALGLRPFDKVPVAQLMENMLPRLLPSVSIRVEENHKMGEAEAITHQSEPVITFSERTYDGMYRNERRARMTAIHELGHLLMHCGGQVGYAFKRRPDRTIDPEWQANVFMAGFMMPACAFKRMSSIKQAMRVFGVSRDAASCRARSLGMHWMVRGEPRSVRSKERGTAHTAPLR